MPINSYFSNMTTDDRIQAKKQANEMRAKYFTDAENNGARINYINSVLLADEKDTLISFNAIDDIVKIDTSDPVEINKCIRCGYKILEITRYRNTGTDRDGKIASVIFECDRKNISFRKSQN